MVNGYKPIASDEEDRETKSGGEVGWGQVGGIGGEKSTCSFHYERCAIGGYSTKMGKQSRKGQWLL